MNSTQFRLTYKENLFTVYLTNDNRLLSIETGKMPIENPSTADQVKFFTDFILAKIAQPLSEKDWAHLATEDLTPFQREVYLHLAQIPSGSVTSYKDLAKAMGAPTKARAVGGALNRNPFLLVVPCHRVVGSDGSLTGFAGGLDLKRMLLDTEACVS